MPHTLSLYWVYHYVHLHVEKKNTWFSILNKREDISVEKKILKFVFLVSVKTFLPPKFYILFGL